MIDRAALGLDSEPDHSHPFQVPGIADLMQLSRALGGGSYPGLGAGQNDSLGFPDSIAPGFPLNIPFVIPGNLVKQQAYKVSFIPAPYRNYAGATGTSTNPHAHTGDTVQTLNIDHGHPAGNENAGHVHVFGVWSLAGTEPNAEQWTVAVNPSGSTTIKAQLNTSVIPSAGSNDHLYTSPDTAIPSDHSHPVNNNGGVTLTSHTHTSTSNTGGEQVHVHTGSPQVTEGTSPDAIRAIVDGVDATTQLGGPWTTQQFELDVTPFVGPGAGIHTVQLLTATQLGRITGWVRQANIVNPISP